MKSIKTIASINALHTLLMLIASPRIFLSAILTIKTILIDFFFMQSALRPKKIRQPFVWIDHPLDENIPFAPEWVTTYIRFIQLWVFGVSWIFCTFGRRSIPFIVESLTEVQQLYHAAASVYKTLQSTTRRPAPVAGNKIFRLIHKTDPHLNCLPSLHVMIVTWVAFKLVPRVKELSGTSETSERREIVDAIEHFQEQALKITESVLYVKQHSINCIPAALYVMKELFQGFEIQYGEQFIRDLFKQSTPPIYERKKVNNHMINLYREFITAGNNKNYTEVLLAFLNQYDKCMG